MDEEQISPKAAVVLTAIAKYLTGVLKEDYDFAVLLFGQGQTFYISSGERDHVIEILEEFIAREKAKASEGQGDSD